MPTPTAPSIPAEWQPGIAALQNLSSGGITLLIGAMDRGKTTFAALAVQQLAAIAKTALVDSDIGQSEIGAPGTVGVAWAEAETTRLHDLKPFATFFVGNFSPIGVMLEHVSATQQAVDRARERNAERILIDTTGLVAGEIGRRLKIAKARAVLPDLVIGIAQGNELEPLLAAIHAATGAAVLTLPVPPEVQRKSANLRLMRRISRLSQALEGARDLPLPLAKTATLGVVLGTGIAIAPHLSEWAGSVIQLPVVYGEMDSNANLTLFLEGNKLPPDWESASAIITPTFRANLVRFVLLSEYANRYVGLHDGVGKLLGVGRFLRFDAARGEMILSAPSPASVERVRLVHFGRVRVGADGSILQR